MKIIVAVDQNWGIGCKGKLLFDIPEDMRHFKGMTLNKVVVMGRNTFESLPGGKPLPDRVNIVLAAEDDFKPREGITLCRTAPETLEKIKGYPTDDVFIIGGGMVYKTFLNYCNEAAVTKVRAAREADSFFPNLDEDENWEKAGESQVKEHDGLKFTFTKYRNVSPFSLSQPVK